MKRLWQYLLSLLGLGNRYDREAEDLAAGAQREIEALHARERARAVQVIGEKIHLEQLVGALEKDALDLLIRIENARTRGDEEEAARLEREKAEIDEYIALKRPELEQARSAADALKAAIRREEERIRQETAERLYQMATWKTSQIEKDLFSDSAGPDVPKAGSRLLLVILILLILMLCLFIGK
jgi:phage shock protein A